MTTATAIALGLLAAIAGLYYRSQKKPCPTDAEIGQILADVDAGKTTPAVANGIADGLATRGCDAAATAIRAVAQLKAAGQVLNPRADQRQDASPGAIFRRIDTATIGMAPNVDRHPMVGAALRMRRS